MTAPARECQPEADGLRRFQIIWGDDARYYVSIPNYGGGFVVDAASYDALQARVEELTKALEPFAKLAAFVVEAHRDSRPVVFGLDHAIVQRLTIGDLRAAGRALAPSLEDGK